MRGTAAGEPVVSQANSDAYREGCKRIFGDKKAEKGRWIWDEAQQKLVRADEYQAPPRAIDGCVMAGRFYENTSTLDGDDIGSRAKHREYMRRNGLASADDFSPQWYEARRRERAQAASKKTREALERKFREINDKPGR